MGPYLGDFAAGSILYFTWDTNDGNGGSINPTVDGTISVYKDANIVQSVAGITDVRAFDGLVGIHNCAIDTSANAAFYTAGSDYNVVLSASTIDGQVVNATLACFSLDNRVITSRMIAELAQSEFADCILVKAVAAIPAQGITIALAASGCIQYEIINVSLTRNFAAPDFTYYLLWRYDALGDVVERKPSLGIVW
jgi:hypothetical protein